jgi:autotransporter-associated beta strand protein
VGGTGALRDLSGNGAVDVWTGKPITLATSSAIGVDANTTLIVTPQGAGINGTAASVLRKVGAGILVLNTPNDYFGATQVQGGVLEAGNALALGDLAGGGITVSDGASLELIGNGITYTKALTLGGAGFLSLGALIDAPGGSNTWGGPITLADSAVVSSPGLGNTLSLTGPISEAAAGTGLTTLGPGTVAFTGGAGTDNTYSGVTTVESGTLLLDKTGGAIAVQAGGLTVGVGSATTTALAREVVGNQIADTAPVTVNSDGTFDLNNNSDTVGAVTVNGGMVTTGTLQVPTGGGLTASGLKMTGGTVTAQAPGTFVQINGDATMTGGTLSAAGAGSQLGVTGTLSETDGTISLTGTGSTLAVGVLKMTGGALNLTDPGSVATLGGDVTATSDKVTGSAVISGAGSLALGSAGRTFTVNAGPGPIDLQAAAVISGSVGLTKAGPGVMQITNADTYKGETTVTAGSLFVDGPSGSIGSVAVTGGLLGGTGSVGAITATGGTVHPGDSPGILNSTGNGSFNKATTFSVQINGPTPGNAVNDYSQLNVTGTFDLGGATLAGSVGNGFVPAVNGPSFTILTSTGALSGQFAQGNATFLSGLKFGISYNTATAPNSVSLTRIKANTTTVVTNAVPNPSTFGDQVTFTATVTPEAGAIGVPTGTVTFKDGSTTLAAGVPLNNIGGVATATFQTSIVQLLGGDHNDITAVYDGSDPDFNGGPSQPFDLKVNRAGTTTTVTGVAPAAPNFDQPFTFTATVTPQAGGNAIGGIEPTGTVAFFADGSATPLGTVTLVTSATGPATATLPLAAGTLLGTAAGSPHQITAVYTPAAADLNYASSDNTKSPFPLAIGAAGTVTAITSEAPPGSSTFDQQVTFTATVTPQAGGNAINGVEPTGTVSFFVDGSPTAVGTVTLVTSATGPATATLPLAAGTLLGTAPGSPHQITAVYTPATADLNYAASQPSQSVSYQVNPAATTTAVPSVAPNSPTFDPALTLTTTVTPAAGGNAIGGIEPTGTVSFFADGSATALATVPLVDSATGPATATLPLAAGTLLGGPHQITASYTPAKTDLNYAASPAPSPSLSFTLGAAATTTAITTVAPAPANFDQALTLTATVTLKSGGNGVAGIEPTGTVSFFADGSATALASAPLIGSATGPATATTAPLAAGTLLGGDHKIIAVYTPAPADHNYATSTSTKFDLPIGPAGTVTAITSETPPGSSTFDQQVTFTATVTPQAGGKAINGIEPTGTVAFFLDGVAIPGAGSVALVGSAAGPATATFQTQPGQLLGTAPGSPHQITAVYTPATADLNYAASLPSQAVSYQVNPAKTTTAVSAAPASPTFDQGFTLTATVTPQVGGNAIGGIEPTGTVAFFADGSPIAGAGSVAVVDSTTGPATATLPLAAGTLLGGDHKITATYTPAGTDFNYAGSPSPKTDLMVKPAATTTTVTGASPSSPTFDQGVTLTATVTVKSGGNGVAGIEPTGTVAFFSDGVAIPGAGSVALVDSAAGPATATLPLPAGTLLGTVAGSPHQITAEYTPAGTDHNYAGSTAPSAPLPLPVGAAATTTTVTGASPSSPTFDQAVTLTATVTVKSSGGNAVNGIEPTGTVAFFADGVAIPGAGSVALVDSATGPATATLPLAAGTLLGTAAGSPHQITAEYTPAGTDHNYAASTAPSAPLPLPVGAAATTTTVTAASPTNPSFGLPVTLTATVTVMSSGGNAVNGIEPTGAVEFFSDGTPIPLAGSVALVDSTTGPATATFTTTATQFSATGHTITATYSPGADVNYKGSSTSPTTSLTLNVSAVSTSTQLASTNKNAAFGEPVITATVSAANAGAGTPPGTVTFTIVNNATTAKQTVPNVALIGNTATLPTVLDAGSYTITAAYSPSSTNFMASPLSAPLSQTVSAATTVLTLTSSPSGSVVFGTPVTFTAAVVTQPPGSGTPVGTVTFTVDGMTIDRTLDGTGHASITETFTGGSHSVNAFFHGGTDFKPAPATGGAVVTSVGQAGSSTTLTVSSGRFFIGQPVTLTATVAGLAPGTGPATGSVSFYDNGKLLDTVSLSGGQASLTTTFAVGGHTLQAVYSGDNNYSTSSALAAATNLGLPITVDVIRVARRPRVEVRNAGDGSLRFAFFPYGSRFHGRVRVAVADVNGDGFPDVIVAPGPGATQPALTFDGRTGAQLGRIGVAPHGSTRGLFVAAGDITGSGRATVVVGVGPEVRGFDGVSGQQLFRFAPFGHHSAQPVRVAVLDVDHDGEMEFMAVAGSKVKGYDGKTLGELPASVLNPFDGQIIQLAGK